MRTHRWAGVVALTLVLLGCVAEDNTTPPRDIAIETERGSLPGVVGWPGVRLHLGMLELQHLGSSGCPGVVSSIRSEGPRAVRVVLWQNYFTCHTDLVPYISRVALPASVRDEPSLTVTIHHDKGPSFVAEDLELIAYRG